MLSGFDWIRRCRTGAELLATLQALHKKPELFQPEEGLGPPPSALDGPCQRCWIHPRAPSKRKASRYCRTCRAILVQAYRLYRFSFQLIVVWGRVNQLPKPLDRDGFHGDRRILGVYIHDANHFLLMMHRRQLKAWLQELALYHGTGLAGLLQILPPTGRGGGIDMADVLCRAVYQEERFPMDRLRVRFFPAPHLILRPHLRDQLGVLTFEIGEFLSLLEMAAIFRTLLYPEAQAALFELLNLDNAREEQFYWGRFLGLLSPEARDMLNAWRIRQWPKERIKLLYELKDYVAFYPLD